MIIEVGPQTLLAALKAAKAGDTIQLAAGDYAALKLDGLKFSGEVTITSADPYNRAILNGLSVTNSSNLTFTDIDVKYAAGQAATVYANVTSNLKFDGLHVIGSSARAGDGVTIRNSSDIVVANSDIGSFTEGLTHLNSTRILFANNVIHGMANDGIRGGGSSSVTITGNYFTDFFPTSGSHNDAIQFWTTNTTASARDLVITDNIFVRGAGKAVQGIFMGNELDLPYENVTITGNAIIGGAYHGINLDLAKNAKVQDNIVVGYKDMTSWIQVINTTSSTVAHNTATSFIIKDNKGAFEGENVSASLIDASSSGQMDLSGYTKSAVIDLNFSGLVDIDGGWGGDRITGSWQGNVIRGMEGNDAILGLDGADDLNGNSGDDTLNGGEGADTVRGGRGDDYVIGGEGDDPYLNGNLGADTIWGGDGADQIFGGQGDDALYGDAGADTLSGDLGNDVLAGGGGADLYKVGTGGGRDWILGFSSGEGDRVQVAGAYILTTLAGQAVLSFEDGSQVGFAGVSIDALGAWLL